MCSCNTMTQMSLCVEGCYSHLFMPIASRVFNFCAFIEKETILWVTKCLWELEYMCSSYCYSTQVVTYGYIWIPHRADNYCTTLPFRLMTNLYHCHYSSMHSWIQNISILLILHRILQCRGCVITGAFPTILMTGWCICQRAEYSGGHCIPTNW